MTENKQIKIGRSITDLLELCISRDLNGNDFAEMNKDQIKGVQKIILPHPHAGDLFYEIELAQEPGSKDQVAYKAPYLSCLIARKYKEIYNNGEVSDYGPADITGVYLTSLDVSNGVVVPMMDFDHSKEKDNFQTFDFLLNGKPATGWLNADLFEFKDRSSVPWILAITLTNNNPEDKSFENALIRKGVVVRHKAQHFLSKDHICFFLGRLHTEDIVNLYFCIDQMRMPLETILKEIDNFSDAYTDLVLTKDPEWKVIKNLGF